MDDNKTPDELPEDLAADRSGEHSGELPADVPVEMAADAPPTDRPLSFPEVPIAPPTPPVYAASSRARTGWGRRTKLAVAAGTLGLVAAGGVGGFALAAAHGPGDLGIGRHGFPPDAEGPGPGGPGVAPDGHARPPGPPDGFHGDRD